MKVVKKSTLKDVFKIEENRSNFMEKCYRSLELTSLEGWMYVTKQRIVEMGGTELLKGGSVLEECKRTYPYYPWPSSPLPLKSILSQRKQLHLISTKLNARSLDQLLNVTKQQVKKAGGQNLLKAHGGSLSLLLSSLYPLHLWSFDKMKIKKKEAMKKIEKQRELMDLLFYKLKLISFDDWKKGLITKLYHNGGKQLLEIYSNDIFSLLRSVYPNYPWSISSSSSPSSSLIFSRLMKEYCIERKRDWYRVPIVKVEREEGVNLYRLLKKTYPNEQWAKHHFISRSKKSTQRILFTHLRSLFPSVAMIENYRHPLLPSFQHLIEIDIFLPSLNFAFEYHGQQHFDDLPFAFNSILSYLSHDQLKQRISKLRGVTLICIPYWWDLSLSSLHTFISPNILSR